MSDPGDPGVPMASMESEGRRVYVWSGRPWDPYDLYRKLSGGESLCVWGWGDPGDPENCVRSTDSGGRGVG